MRFNVVKMLSHRARARACLEEVIVARGVTALLDPLRLVSYTVTLILYSPLPRPLSLVKHSSMNSERSSSMENISISVTLILFNSLKLWSFIILVLVFAIESLICPYLCDSQSVTHLTVVMYYL